MSVPSIRSHEAESEGVVLLRKSEPKSLVRRANGLLRLTLVDGRVLDARFVVAAIDREVEVDALAAMNLPVAKKGIQADHRTGATGIPGVFAAGESVLGPSYGVRAVASAREVAMIVDRYLRGESISPLPPRINCRMGRLTEDELAIIRDAASRAPRLKPEHVGSQSIGEARRCLQCGCSTRDDCALRDIASSFSANPSRFKGPRRAFARDESHEDVVYEPNKCILCGLCIQAAAEKGEQLGLTFIDRGFAATTAVPFGRMLADGLKSAGDACVSLCPTGALSFKLGPRRGRT